MKRQFAYLCLAVILGALLCGSSTRAEIQLGGKAGLALADQEFDYYTTVFDRNIEWRFGVAGGIFAQTRVLPYLGLRVEALYVQKGYKEDFTSTDETGGIIGTETFQTRLDVLSLNLLGTGNLHTGTYAMIGPRLDIKLGTDSDIPEGAMPQELEDTYASTIAGLTIGAGQELSVTGLGTVFFEGQYYLDVGKLYDRGTPGEDEITTLKSIKNRSFAFFAGLRF